MGLSGLMFHRRNPAVMHLVPRLNAPHKNWKRSSFPSPVPFMLALRGGHFLAEAHIAALKYSRGGFSENMPLAYDEIVHLAQQKENATTEFKRELSPDVLDGLSTDLASLANAQGGRIIIGVTREGDPTGYAHKPKDREHISQRAKNCQPPVVLDFEEVRTGEKYFLIVVVPPSKVVHSDSDHRIPFRVGDITAYLDSLAILMLFRERSHVSADAAGQIMTASREERMRTPLSAEEGSRFGQLLKSTDPIVQGEAIRDLEKEAYRHSIMEDESVATELESLMRKGAATEELNRQLMSIARAVVLAGSESEKLNAVRWLPDIAKIAELSPSAETARAAFDVLGAAHDKRAVDVMLYWVTQADEPKFKALAPETLLQNIRWYGLHQPMSDAMYGVLESETQEGIRARAQSILRAVREAYGYS